MRYQWIGAGVIACTPLPVVDMLATAAVNAQMVVEIGQDAITKVIEPIKDTLDNNFNEQIEESNEIYFDESDDWGSNDKSKDYW